MLCFTPTLGSHLVKKNQTLEDASTFLVYQKTIVIALLLSLFGCCAALPVNFEDTSNPLIGIPIFLQGSTAAENKRQDDSPPVAYALLLSKLDGAEENPKGALVEKRSVKENEEEDLETAAGTYALRPLFVYRQQLAYKQRVREANRRRNRF